MVTFRSWDEQYNQGLSYRSIWMTWYNASFISTALQLLWHGQVPADNPIDHATLSGTFVITHSSAAYGNTKKY